MFELCVHYAGVHGGWVWNSSSVSHQESVRPGGELHTVLFSYRLLRCSVHKLRMAVLVVYMRKLGSWQCKFGQLIQDTNISSGTLIK